MLHVPDMTLKELSAVLAELGQPAFRAKQIGLWVWTKGICDFAAMTDLPAALRETLPQRLSILSGRIAQQTTSDDDVLKLLLEFPDGAKVETVLIPTARFATACVSTQVGCAMGCTFCASGSHGVVRNLTAGEIVEQILHLQQASGQPVTHVVFMGTGEPLANYQAVVRAIHTIIDPNRLGISARRVTVSTVGIPEQIRKLAAEDLPVTLAISLHAPNDELRRRIMPTAAKYPLADIVSAAAEFFEARGREVTLEYLVLPGINDTQVCVEALVQLAGHLRCSVNLISYNPVEGVDYRRPSIAEMANFAKSLRARGLNVQIRRSRGGDTDAACGQLRARHDEGEP